MKWMLHIHRLLFLVTHTTSKLLPNFPPTPNMVMKKAEFTHLGTNLVKPNSPETLPLTQVS